MIAWIAFKSCDVSITKGEPKCRASSDLARRSFCADCGTGLFYTNEALLPGLTDIQSATLDDAEADAPSIHVQYAEHLSWTEKLHELPQFERYPPGLKLRSKIGIS
jgi:hypothetical protein